MKTVLITYATPEYTRAKRLLAWSAKRQGVDQVISYGRSDLQASQFYKDNRKILDQPRGGGYWLWKPYFILQTLKQMNAGDVLIYADAGMFFRKPVKLLTDLTKSSNCIFFYNAIRCGQYTKRDLFVRLNCDTEEYHSAPMVHAGLQVYRKSDEAIQFLESVLSICTEGDLITDAPNTCGLPNLQGFIEHRHDQSIFSLMAHVHRKTVYADPSQFIVRNANFEFGKGDIPLKTLPYNRVVYIHRYKNGQIWKLVPDTLSKIFRLR